MRLKWARRLIWATPFVFGCKSLSGPPDDPLLVNRHPVEAKTAYVDPSLLVYHEPTPPAVPWLQRPRSDYAENPRVRPGSNTLSEPRTVPGTLTNQPKPDPPTRPPE